MLNIANQDIFNVLQRTAMPLEIQIEKLKKEKVDLKTLSKELSLKNEKLLEIATEQKTKICKLESENETLQS